MSNRTAFTVRNNRVQLIVLAELLLMESLGMELALPEKPGTELLSCTIVEPIQLIMGAFVAPSDRQP